MLCEKFLQPRRALAEVGEGLTFIRTVGGFDPPGGAGFGEGADLFGNGGGVEADV